MSNLRPLLERNRFFAATGAHAGLEIMSRQPVFLVTCLDPRVDPAAFLGVEAVTDPAASVRTDVQRLLSSPKVPPQISVSGHVYDLQTGLVTAITGPSQPGRALAQPAPGQPSETA